MNATLYDPSDVAFGAQPRLMCAACGKREVGIYEPVCPECRKSLEQAGILKPQDQRQQIGPLQRVRLMDGLGVSMKNEEIFYTHKQNAVVDNSGKQIAIVLPSNCTMREARAMAAFAAQQMNHELRAKKLKKSNA